jgi:hypothetical protein
MEVGGGVVCIGSMVRQCLGRTLRVALVLRSGRLSSQLPRLFPVLRCCLADTIRLCHLRHRIGFTIVHQLRQARLKLRNKRLMRPHVLDMGAHSVSSLAVLLLLLLASSVGVETECPCCGCAVGYNIYNARPCIPYSQAALGLERLFSQHHLYPRITVPWQRHDLMGWGRRVTLSMSTTSSVCNT